MAFAPKRAVLAKKRKAQASSKNENKFVLDRVLGLTCVNNNLLAVTTSNCIVYPAGCTIILFYPKKNIQSHIVNPSKKPISCLCVGADKYLAYGEYGHSPSIRIWDISVTPPTEISKLTGHAFGISCLSFSPNLRYLVSVGYQHDQNIFVWSWKSCVKVATNKITTKISGISFHEDGKYFVTVGNRRVRYWYFDSTAKDIKSKAIHPLNGRSAILGNQQNRKFVAVCCGSGSFKQFTYVVTSNGLLFQFNVNREIDRMLDVRSGSCYCVCTSDTHVVVGCAEGTVRVFDPVTLDYVVSLPHPHPLGVKLSATNVLSNDKGKHPDCVAMAFSNACSKLVVIYNDHSLYSWDIKNLSQIGKAYSCLYHNAGVWDISSYSSLSSDKALLPENSFITCSSDNTIRFWSQDLNNTSSEFCFKNIYSKELIRIIYDTDNDDVSCLRDASKLPGDCTAMSDVTRGTRCVELHPTGHQLATGDRKGNLKIYDLDFMDKQHDIMAHDAEILTISYSKCSTWLATGSRDRLIHVFDVSADYIHTHTISDHSAAITSLQFTVHSDAIQLVSCGVDKSLMIQEIRMRDSSPVSAGNHDSTPRSTTGGTNAIIKRVNHIVEKSTVYDMVVDPSMNTISTVGQDRVIRIYHAGSCKQKAAYKGGASDEASTVLLKVAIDPSGLFIATSGSDKIVCLFEFSTGECIAKLHGHSEVITALRFSNCCNYLYTASGDSCIFIWKLSPELTQRMYNQITDVHPSQPVIMRSHRHAIRKRTFCVSASSSSSKEAKIAAIQPASSVPTVPAVTRSISSSVVSAREEEQEITDNKCTDSMEGMRAIVSEDLTDSIDQDVFNEVIDDDDDDDGFKFELDQLPNWAQNQVLTRPSVAESVGIDIEQEKITITESSSHVSHVTGKWAERIEENLQLFSTESSCDGGDISTDDTAAKQSILNFEPKLQLKDLPLELDEELLLQEDDEVVYPVKERDSVDPSMFQVSTPEKKSSLLSVLDDDDDTNKENIPSEVDTATITAVDSNEEEEEEEEPDSSGLNQPKDFLKANFESLTADELCLRQELMEELIQISPRRPSISTMYLKKSRSRFQFQSSGTEGTTRGRVSPLAVTSPSTQGRVSPLAVTSPSAHIQTVDPSVIGEDEIDAVTILTTHHSNDGGDSLPDPDTKRNASEDAMISDTPPDVTSVTSSSCDTDDSKELKPHPPQSDIDIDKPNNHKITAEDIDRTRRRLEELGYSEEYVHGNKNKKTSKGNSLETEHPEIPTIDTPINEAVIPSDVKTTPLESGCVLEKGEGDSLLMQMEDSGINKGEQDEKQRAYVMDQANTLITDLNQLISSIKTIPDSSRSVLVECGLAVNAIKQSVIELEQIIDRKLTAGNSDHLSVGSLSWERNNTNLSPTQPYLNSEPTNLSTPLDLVKTSDFPDPTSDLWNPTSDPPQTSDPSGPINQPETIVDSPLTSLIQDTSLTQPTIEVPAPEHQCWFNNTGPSDPPFVIASNIDTFVSDTGNTQAAKDDDGTNDGINAASNAGLDVDKGSTILSTVPASIIQPLLDQYSQQIVEIVKLKLSTLRND